MRMTLYISLIVDSYKQLGGYVHSVWSNSSWALCFSWNEILRQSDQNIGFIIVYKGVKHLVPIEMLASDELKNWDNDNV